MRNKITLILLSVAILALFSGCTNQSAARVGNGIGRVLGKPLGLVATTADQAFRTTGEILIENLRQQRELREQPQQAGAPATIAKVPEQNRPLSTIDGENVRYPQKIELLSQQQTENGEEFWR